MYIIEEYRKNFRQKVNKIFGDSMEIIWSIIIGYLLGSINPAAFISKMKQVDLRDRGTGNLGATNTLLVIGKKYGIMVMIFDIAKSYFAVKIAQILFKEVVFSGILAGTFSVVGHIYPFYMKFKGGKGLASFGGTILALDYVLFGILLLIALVCMFIVNYTVAIPISAAILFPFMYGMKVRNFWVFVISLALSGLIIANHIANIKRVRRGDDVKMREFVLSHIFGSRNDT